MMPTADLSKLYGDRTPTPNYEYGVGGGRVSLQPDIEQLRREILQASLAGQDVRGPLLRYTAVHHPGHTALWQRILNSDTRDLRKAYAITAVLAGVGMAGAAAGGAGAAGAGGGGAGGGAGAGIGGSAATIDPFAANLGGGATWGAAGSGGGAAGFFDADGMWHVTSGGGGGSGLAKLFGAGSSGGGMSWQEMILHGIPVLTNYLGAREQAQQAKAYQDAQRRQRAETLAFASPEAYTANYERYLSEFEDANKPWLKTEADRAAIGEQTAMQGFDTDLARRGLSGSGLAFAGRSAIRTGREAQLNENMRRYRQMNEEAARDAAGQTRSAQISASVGAPYSYVPRPSPTTAAVQGLGDAYRDWLWLQGTQNNPFVSKKDQRNIYG
jgi:hypothetical protein